MKKILFFSDSRGQHKPTGSDHKLFIERLATTYQGDFEIYLCPFKWTTILDFISLFPAEHSNAKYDLVILYAGIVDWSPRKKSSAINDLYMPNIEINLGNLSSNSYDYGKKIVNRKKISFDGVFGEKAMLDHFLGDLGVEYEGENTQNMYSAEMAEKLVVCLNKYNNLVFINANKFVNGWSGDYTRERPANISIVEDYSKYFRDGLNCEFVDLLAWEVDDVKKFTCDNLHLTMQGSDFIFRKLTQIMDRRGFFRRRGMEGAVGAVSNYDVVVSINKQIRRKDYDGAFGKSLNNLKRTGKYVYFQSALYCALKLKDEYKIKTLLDTFSRMVDVDVDQNSINYDYLRYLKAISPNSVFDYALALSKIDFVSDELVDKLCLELLGSRAKLQKYIAARSVGISTRIDNEFCSMSAFYKKFPYNYISDYSENIPVFNKVSKPFSISFIYPIKNRASRTRLSLISLEQSYSEFKNKHSLYAEVIVVEDNSSSLLSLDSDHFSLDIEHHLVKTGVSWTRSGLLNFGMSKAHGKLYIFTDCDVIFPKDFFDRLASVLASVDTNKHLLAINMFESHSHIKDGKVTPKGTPYSYMWCVNRKLADSVKGFSEEYIGWGSEDRDFEYRVNAANGSSTVASFNIDPHLYVIHFSHNERTGIENKSVNSEILKDKNISGGGVSSKSLLKIELVRSLFYKNKPTISPYVANLLKGDDYLREKTLVIMGNGPSLADIMNNKAILNILRSYDTFGLNAAYRAYEKYDFYPTYFGSFDFRVCDSHLESYIELIESDFPIKKYFFARQSIFPNQVRENNKFQNINFIAAPKGVSQQVSLSESFDEFFDCGSSGTNAVQAGYILGYRRFILVGVDCNYVEIIDGVKDIDGIRYEVVDKIDNNPNYWFEGYQKPGDLFHKPNEKDIQLVSWEKLKSISLPIRISNCSSKTKLNVFDRLPFGIAASRYENIFIVLSCKAYRHRIDALRPYYKNSCRSRDMFLFVVGDSSHDYYDPEANVLYLSCGDTYEDLPDKVYRSIKFCADNFSFDLLVKTDDDVIVNFGAFYDFLNRGVVSYFGKRTPSRSGIKPSNSWHLGKVSNESEFSSSNFQISAPPSYWCGGGLYVLSRENAVIVSDEGFSGLAKMHLYEDYMVGDILDRRGVLAEVWDPSVARDNGEWCITDLRAVMDSELNNIVNSDKVLSSISVHCGPYPPYYPVSKQKLIELFDIFSHCFGI